MSAPKGQIPWNKGKKGVQIISEETKKKMSLAGIGRKPSEETRKKLHLAQLGNKKWLGKKHSEESKLKMSLAKRGKKLTDETKKKLSKIASERVLSQETKDKISNSLKGEKCYRWLGGISSLPYTLDWTETLKRSIRERDHYQCKLCGKNQEDELLSVHHIDYDKKNCNPDNLISLCRVCHSKTNYKRDYWKEYFNKLIK